MLLGPEIHNNNVYSIKLLLTVIGKAYLVTAV